MSFESPRVESFVLRFVHDTPDDGASPDAHAWRGVVVHVQSNTEINFTDFADAVAFIARYVPVGNFIFTTERTKGTEKK
ncbi:MAG: hypothetical protein HY868_00420 [Chloroflexi bacterium]|nr:hypothetical protein [Chloroflexota bacterium]